MENNITKFEQQLIDLIIKCRDASSVWEPLIISSLRQIMPPTCGIEQRKLLDQMEGISPEEIGLFDLYDIEVDWDKVIRGE